MPIQVRNSKESDAWSLHQYIIEKYGHSSKENPTGVDISESDLLTDGNFGEDCRQKKYFETIVAEEEGRIIGILVYYYIYAVWLGKLICLKEVFCQPERLKEATQELLKKLAQIAKEEGLEQICFDGIRSPIYDIILKLGGVDMTNLQGWNNFYFDTAAVKSFLAVDISDKLNTTSKVKIRAARRTDCQSICDQIKELAVFENFPDSPQLSAQDLIKDGFDTEFPLYYCLVAEHTDEAGKVITVGYAMYFFTYDLARGKMVHLEDFYVKPEFRGQGIGKLLFHRVGQEVVQSSACRLALQCLEWNIQAVMFYEKRGGVNFTKKFEEHDIRFFKESIDKLTNLTIT